MPILIQIITLLLLLVFTFLSGLHFYWGLGGRWGFTASVPTKENSQRVMHPKPAICFVVGFGMLFFGYLVLGLSKLFVLYLPAIVMRYGLWVLAIIFFLRAIGDFEYVGFFKKVRTTLFGRYDTKYYSPLCLCLTVLLIILELSRQPD